MPENAQDFVEWREKFISQERGSRVVHYYLDNSSGESFLAVVGTERSLRHMLYVVSDEFSQVVGSDGAGISSLKWRSRREVVDWLTSFLPKQICARDNSNFLTSDSLQGVGANIPVYGINGSVNYVHKHTDPFTRSLKGYNSDIVWSGVPWTCGKQLRHYRAFGRNGTTIATHSFVLVMSEEEENRYLAYLEDMYEDKKGQKKVKVRWFHKNQEVARTIPPPPPHPREVFITPYSQVISAECVDDLATVLTPEHYQKCLAALSHTFPAGIHLCFRQYSKNKFKPFDLSTLRGYFNQMILSCLDVCTVSGGEEQEFCQGNNVERGHKKFRSGRRHQKLVPHRLGIGLFDHASQKTSCSLTYRNFKFGLSGRRSLAVKFIGPRPWLNLPFKVDQKIELLCQDSGIRGCWFRCTVLQLSQKQLKVQYDDVQNEDGSGNLEEWIPTFRAAAPDKLGMRCSGRLTIRPCLQGGTLAENAVFKIGSPVDAWWSDGWWEGVVIGVDGCGADGLQVYFPGEDIFLICRRRNLRISKDWTGNLWIDIKAKPDILSVISAVSPGTKLSTCSTFAKRSESGGSAMSEREATTVLKSDANEDMQAPAGLGSGTNELMEDTNHVNSKQQNLDVDSIMKDNISDGDEMVEG